MFNQGTTPTFDWWGWG